MHLQWARRDSLASGVGGQRLALAGLPLLGPVVRLVVAHWATVVLASMNTASALAGMRMNLPILT